MTIENADPARMDPQEYARLVKRASDDAVRRLMRSDRRTAVLDHLFQGMPGAFRPDRGASVNAVVHWKVGDRPDGGVDTYEMIIADGSCSLSPRPERRPKLTLSLGAVDFLHLVTGNAHPVVLVMKGRLKTTGDLGLTAKFPSLFDVPKP